MKVILLTELKGKGGEGDVVEVAPGFFNNYLGPQKMAILATKGNLKQHSGPHRRFRPGRHDLALGFVVPVDHR